MRQVKIALEQYVGGGISFGEFQRCLVVGTWHLDMAEHHANAVKLLVAEYTSGHWTEAELVEKLRPYQRKLTASA